MSVKYIYAGTTQVESAVKIKGPITSATSAADGSVSEAEVTINDPTGVAEYLNLQEFAIEETTATPPRLWTGRIADLTNERGPYLTGKGRIWRFKLADLNTLLHWQILKGAIAKRPAETGDARIAWLLTELGGLVYNNGLVGPGTAMYGEADYRGKYADVVLPDISLSSSVDHVFCVYYDHPTGQPSLFYDLPTAAVNDCTLRLSTVPSDCDDIDDPAATTFYMHPNPSLVQAGQAIYCGVWFVYKGIPIYRHSSTTHAAFFGSSTNHRDGVYETDRIGTLATAETHAAAFLAMHSGSIDTITCTVKLPAAKATLIEAAQRIQVRFENFTNYDDPGFTWMRIARRSFVLTEGSNLYYDLQLELSMRGITGTGGGGGGSFPHQPPVPPPIVQFVSGLVNTGAAGELTLPHAPTVGNTLVTIVYGNSPAVTLDNDHPWVEHPAGLIGITGIFNDSARMAYRPVTSGDGAAIEVAELNAVRGVLWEIAGVVTPDATAFAEVSTTVQPASANAGTITVTGPSLILAGIVIQSSSWAGNDDTTIGDDAAYTTQAKHEVNNAIDNTEPFTADTSHPVTWAGTLSPTVAGSYTPAVAITGAGNNFGGWGGLQMAFTAAAADNPPTPGQEEPWAVVAMTTVGGVSTGTTLYPYAAGSLKVKVDGVFISRASYVESDPTTGAFALTWIKDTDEVVTVSYQGI